MFKERKVFDTGKIKPGMVAKLTPMIRQEGEEWPGCFKNGPNYGVVTGATMEQVDLLIFNYFEYERRQAHGGKDLIQSSNNYPMRRVPIRIDEVTGHLPILKLEVVEP